MEAAGFSEILVIYTRLHGLRFQKMSLESQYSLKVRQLYRHLVVLMFITEGAVGKAHVRVLMDLSQSIFF
jgi:hypothetical protein